MCTGLCSFPCLLISKSCRVKGLGVGWLRGSHRTNSSAIPYLQWVLKSVGHPLGALDPLRRWLSQRDWDFISSLVLSTFTTMALKAMGKSAGLSQQCRPGSKPQPGHGCSHTHSGKQLRILLGVCDEVVKWLILSSLDL